MSRDMRHKQESQVGQMSAKKTAPTNNNSFSSDDDYAGVDLVSDGSDEEEPAVEDAETSAFMEAGEITEISDDDNPSDFSEQLSLGDLDDDDASPKPYEESQFFNDQLVAAEHETGSEDTPRVERPRQRNRVRFQSPSSDSGSSVTVPPASSEGELYMADHADIFWDRDSLNPEFRRQIDADVPSSEASSYWDLEPELGGPQPNLIKAASGSNRSSVCSSGVSSSGYESEEISSECSDPFASSMIC